MNLKERGITVGDLLLIIIFIISSMFIVKIFKENKQQANNYIIPIEIPKDELK